MRRLLSERAGSLYGFIEGSLSCVGNAMLPLIADRRSEIADICRRFGVRRLAVFGSAARSTDFEPERSDVDFLVAFEPAASPSLGEYFALREALQAAVGRPVDLVVEAASAIPSSAPASIGRRRPSMDHDPRLSLGRKEERRGGRNSPRDPCS